MSRPGASRGERPWGPLLAVLVLSAAWESLFVFRGINQVDEGWPLYAAMQLHAGGTLYRDVFFVFPPGHLLPAWLGILLDPPGVVASRAIYAALNVALVGALYLLGRRLMAPGWALLGAALVAVAAPNSHFQQLLFGYRYLVFAVLALLAFAQRLRTGDLRFMALAGLLAGIGLCFRLTPSLAVTAGIGVGVLAAGRTWAARWRDAGAFAAGALCAVVPVVGWLAWSVGPGTLWLEVIVRPVAMTALQEKPIPPLRWPPSLHVSHVVLFFVAALFRLGFLTYGAYAVVLGARWVRSVTSGGPAPSPLLLATASFGGIFFVRSLGRSDEPHLMSAIPPLCLLFAHALGAAFARWPGASSRAGRAVQVAVGALVLGLWMWGGGTERITDAKWRGAQPVAALDDRVVVRPGHLWLDPTIEAIVAATGPDDRVLVLGPESLFFVLAGRRGPGWADVLMPGTFLDAREERAFVDRLRASPPAVVVVPKMPFDLMPSRSIERQAPQLVGFVRANYRDAWANDRYVLMRRRARP